MLHQEKEHFKHSGLYHEHWASGRIEKIKANLRILMFDQAINGIYNEKSEIIEATCECAAG